MQTNTKRTKTMARAARGFSLLELTLVLLIIGALMAVAAFNVMGQGTKARIKATKASMSVIKQGITSYWSEHSAYPPDLNALITAKILEQKKLKDGFEQPFWYASPGANNQPFDLRSSGEDKQFNTADDIDVWTMDN